MAAPLSGCNKIVMVSNGQGDVGASKITEEILDIVAKLPKAVESLTGVDISKVCWPIDFLKLIEKFGSN